MREIDEFRATVTSAVGSVLGPQGFKKRGQVWHRGLGEVVHLVSLQSSVSSTSNSLRLTVNLAVACTMLLEDGERPSVWTAHWRKRLGNLMPTPSDKWWVMSNTIDASSVAREISEELVTYALPTFDRLQTSEALASLWRTGKSPGLTPTQAARFLAVLDTADP